MEKIMRHVSKVSQIDLLNCIKFFIQNEIAIDICKQEFGPLFGSQVDEVTG